jgi:hypothetical protein
MELDETLTKKEMDIIFLQRQYFLEESQALAGWI